MYLLEGPSSRISSAINSTTLEAFRGIYGASAFHCRYHNCSQTVRSFASKREREEHERCHARRLKCLDPKCTFYATGFKTPRSLKSHNAKYHAQAHDGDIPDRVGLMSNRRTQQADLAEYQIQLMRKEAWSQQQERSRRHLDDQEHATETDSATLPQQTLGAQDLSLTSATLQEQGNLLSGTSSYWSVPEQQEFTELVQNYYSRLAKKDTAIELVAHEADKRVRKRGFIPLTPTPRDTTNREQSAPNKNLPSSPTDPRKNFESVEDGSIEQGPQDDEQGTENLTGQNQRLQPTELGDQVPQAKLSQDDLFPELQTGGLISHAVENLQIFVPPEVAALGQEKTEEYLLTVRRNYTQAQDLIISSRSKLQDLLANRLDNDLGHLDNELLKMSCIHQAHNGVEFLRNFIQEQNVLRAKRAEQDGSPPCL